MKPASQNPSSDSARLERPTIEAMSEREKELREIFLAHGLSYEAFLDLRSDCYEHALATTPDDLDKLYTLLLSPGLSMLQVQELAPPWPSGPKRGNKPGTTPLTLITKRIRTERMLANVEANAKIIEAARTQLKAQLPNDTTLQEETLDQVITLIGNEAIQQTLTNGDPKTRNDGAKILLKRADQRRFDRRMRFLEQQAEKTKKVLSNETLTPEQREQQIKQIFGIQ